MIVSIKKLIYVLHIAPSILILCFALQQRGYRYLKPEGLHPLFPLILLIFFAICLLFFLSKHKKGKVNWVGINFLVTSMLYVVSLLFLYTSLIINNHSGIIYLLAFIFSVNTYFVYRKYFYFGIKISFIKEDVFDKYFKQSQKINTDGDINWANFFSKPVVIMYLILFVNIIFIWIIDVTTIRGSTLIIINPFVILPTISILVSFVYIILLLHRNTRSIKEKDLEGEVDADFIRKVDKMREVIPTAIFIVSIIISAGILFF